MNSKTLIRVIGNLVLRGWLVFSVLAAIGFVLWLIMDRDDPLHSDDPYLAGLFVGIVGACLSSVYTVMESIAQRFRRRHLTDLGADDKQLSPFAPRKNVLSRSERRLCGKLFFGRP